MSALFVYLSPGSTTWGRLPVKKAKSSLFRGEMFRLSCGAIQTISLYSFMEGCVKGKELSCRSRLEARLGFFNPTLLLGEALFGVKESSCRYVKYC